MTPEMVQTAAELGIVAFVFLMFFSVFLVIHIGAVKDAKEDRKSHKEERTEWRVSAESQAEKVTGAITELARSINRVD